MGHLFMYIYFEFLLLGEWWFAMLILTWIQSSGMHLYTEPYDDVLIFVIKQFNNIGFSNKF